MAVAARVIAGPAAQQVVYGDAKRLAAQVPQGDIDRGHRSRVHVPPAEELAPPQRLPDVLDPGGIHPPQDGRIGVDEALERQLLPIDAGLPEPGQPLVGVDLDECVVAFRARSVMYEERLDVGDLHLALPPLSFPGNWRRCSCG